jgi:hypothetical protein
MPRVWNVVLQMVAGMRPVIAQVERHDKEMARRVRSAVTNVALEVAQGMEASYGSRGSRYGAALGSARQAESSIETAHALGYAHVDRALIAQLREITGTLTRMVERRRVGS